jgi:hypothetical protein
MITIQQYQSLSAEIISAVQGREAAPLHRALRQKDCGPRGKTTRRWRGGLMRLADTINSYVRPSPKLRLD